MKRAKMPLLIGLAAFGLASCDPGESSASSSEEGSGSAETSAEAPINAPEDAASVGEAETLVNLTCNDFLAAAAVAQDESDPDAATAAQDALVAILIWLHGYRYASDPQIGPMSEQWMASVSEGIYNQCSAADDPATTKLFDVATS